MISDYDSQFVMFDYVDDEDHVAGFVSDYATHVMRDDVAPGRVPITRVHDVHRQVFPYPCFNRVQSESFSVVYESDVNVVVSAPTGSGKTGTRIARRVAGI